MNFGWLIGLLEANPIIRGGEAVAQQAAQTAGNAAQVADAVVPPAGQVPFGAGGSSTLVMVAMYVVVFGALYFFMIRPQRKREKAVKEMQAEIRSGDNVLTSSGFYGKVVDVGEDCFVIEFGTNRGIRIPVRKADIIGTKTPNINPSTREIVASSDNK